MGSKRGPVGWGPVGEELHALTARETIATATTVRLRRDIGDSGGVDETADRTAASNVGSPCVA